MAGRSNRTVPRGVVSSAGNEAFDACRNGNLALIKKLINTTNANLKDKSGRKSSPLHFAAGLSILLIAYTKPLCDLEKHGCRLTDCVLFVLAIT